MLLDFLVVWIGRCMRKNIRHSLHILLIFMVAAILAVSCSTPAPPTRPAGNIITGSLSAGNIALFPPNSVVEIFLSEEQPDDVESREIAKQIIKNPQVNPIKFSLLTFFTLHLPNFLNSSQLIFTFFLVAFTLNPFFLWLLIFVLRELYSIVAYIHLKVWTSWANMWTFTYFWYNRIKKRMPFGSQNIHKWSGYRISRD